GSGRPRFLGVVACAKGGQRRCRRSETLAGGLSRSAGPDQARSEATTSSRGSWKSRLGANPWSRRARLSSTELAGRGAGRGGSSSAVLIGLIRSGSWPAAANTARANPYQLTAPWLVVWNTPG